VHRGELHGGPSLFRAHERSTRGNAVASQGRTSAKTGYTTSRDAILVDRMGDGGWGAGEWLKHGGVTACRGLLGPDAGARDTVPGVTPPSVSAPPSPDASQHCAPPSSKALGGAQ